MNALSDKTVFEIQTKLLNNDIIRRLLYYNTPDALAKENAPIKSLVEKHISNAPLEFMDEGENQKLANFIVVYIPTIDFNYENINNTIMVDVMVDREQWVLDNKKIRLYQLVNEITKTLDKKKLSIAGKLQVINATYIIVENRFLGYQISINALEERLEDEFY